MVSFDCNFEIFLHISTRVNHCIPAPSWRSPTPPLSTKASASWTAISRALPPTCWYMDMLLTEAKEPCIIQYQALTRLGADLLLPWPPSKARNFMLLQPRFLEISTIELGSLWKFGFRWLVPCSRGTFNDEYVWTFHPTSAWTLALFWDDVSWYPLATIQHLSILMADGFTPFTKLGEWTLTSNHFWSLSVASMHLTLGRSPVPCFPSPPHWRST